jgi:hypothetical protein
VAQQEEKIYRVSLSHFFLAVGAMGSVIVGGFAFIVTQHIDSNESLQSNVEGLEVAINEIVVNQREIRGNDAECRRRQIEVEGKIKTHGMRLHNIDVKLQSVAFNRELINECLLIVRPPRPN